VLKVGVGASAGEAERAAQWKARAEAAVQRGVESARASEAEWTAQEKATEETTKQWEAGAAKAHEAEADECAAATTTEAAKETVVAA
jgi:hypothetical protein